MTKLKGIILSVEDTLLTKNKFDKATFNEIKKLMRFFKLRGLKPVLLANKHRWIKAKEGTKKDLYKYLENTFKELIVFSHARDPRVPLKPQTASTTHVLNEMGWKSNEVLCLGSSHTDMKTAINGGLLFLRATWYADKTQYGFEFDAPINVARFIDTLCLRTHFWSHQVIDGDFEYYALAPFSTFRPDLKQYSEHARQAAKFGRGQVDFWLGALVTSLYFTGLHQRIDYVTAYPGHRKGYGNPQMDNDLETFGDCFRKAYIVDLILRHTTATKLQHARRDKKPVSHNIQLNTIKLNSTPKKKSGSQYARSPLKTGKTVLLIDDFCTAGLSLESGRQYIEQTGAKTIMVSWLKTINRDYQTLTSIPSFDPYDINTFDSITFGKRYNYHEHHVDKNASDELGDTLSKYINWDWPE